MNVAAGALPATSNTGRPAEIRVSKTMRHRLAFALATLTRLPISEARAVIAERAALGETPDEIEAYLQATYQIDPTGVTAVRNITRERGY